MPGETSLFSRTERASLGKAQGSGTCIVTATAQSQAEQGGKCSHGLSFVGHNMNALRRPLGPSSHHAIPVNTQPLQPSGCSLNVSLLETILVSQQSCRDTVHNRSRFQQNFSAVHSREPAVSSAAPPSGGLQPPSPNTLCMRARVSLYCMKTASIYPSTCPSPVRLFEDHIRSCHTLRTLQAPIVLSGTVRKAACVTFLH